MKSQRPSAKLMFLLGISIVLAAFTVGRSYLGDSSPAGENDYFETFEPVEASGAERSIIGDWEPPAALRDPFLPVDFGG